jgi:hypothetical protein
MTSSNVLAMPWHPSFADNDGTKIKIASNKGGGAPKGACHPLSARRIQTSPPECARARKRAERSALAFRRSRRGTRHASRNQHWLSSGPCFPGLKACVSPG